MVMYERRLRSRESKNNQLMRRHANRTCLDSSQMPPLRRNGMVSWDIRRQVKFLNRHGDSSPCDPWSSTSFVKGSKENFDLESDEDSTDENDNEDIGEEREDADEDDKKAIRRVGNGLRENTRKAQKLKHRMQSFKKTRRKRFITIMVGRSINLWPAKRYKKAEINLLEVIESRGAVFKRPIPSHDLRLKARKRIDDACLVDNLGNVSSKLAPGEAERFRRPHSADGQVERWLECADSTPVQVKKQLADTSDSLMKMMKMMRRHENRTFPDSSQMPPLKSNGMVQSGIRHQVKFLNRHEDSRTCDPWSSTRFAKGSKENFDDESDEDDSHDDEEDVGEEREDMGEDDEKAVREVGNGLRENKRTAKKVKHETQSFKKTRRKKFNKIIAGSSINRRAAKMCKKAEINLLEVESKGAVFKSLIPRPSPRLEARKRIDDTCLVDNLRNVSSKLAPGGAERFRKPHSADGQGERWLDSDDSTLVQVKKQLADTSDSLMKMKQMMRRHENRTCPDSSQMPPLKSNGMVQSGIRHQVKFLNRHEDSRTCDPWSSTRFAKGSKEKFDDKSDEDDSHDDEEDVGEEREDMGEDDEKAVREVGNGLRENTRTAKKVKHETQSFKKTRRKKFNKIIAGSSINRRAAKMCKKAEINLLEVESKGAVFKSLIPRPSQRLKARKRIDGTCLVDNLRNVSSKLAPGGAERFRKPHSTDGQGERWLDIDDSTLVQVKKQLADTSDSLMKMKKMMRRHENRTFPDSSQMPHLKSNGMVQSGIRHQVKFLNRHEDSRTCDPWSSTRFAKGSKENFDDESDEDVSHDDEEDVGEEREDMGEDCEKAVREVGNGLRENTRTAKKVKHETQSFKKTRRIKFNKIIAGSSINRRAAKMCKKAEINLLEVESKGAVFKSLNPRPSPRLKARKRIDDTCLVDNLRNVSSKLAPGGAERFRKPHSADGQGERWLDSDDSTLVQVKKQLADTSDSLVGMKDTLPLSTSKLLEAWKSCGGGPKRRVKSEKAPEGTSKNQSEEMKATQVKDSSIQIEEGIDLDSFLEYDIFKDVRNKRFETPVADQKGHLNCAPVCISQCIGLTYAIGTQSYTPELAAQEPINWMELHEPGYYVCPDLLRQRFIEDGTKRRSFPMSMSDGYSYVLEKGIHTERNYPFAGYCTNKFHGDVKKFEKMRSTYLKGMPQERFSIDSFKYLNVDTVKGHEAGIIQEVKAALRAGRPVSGMIWASKAFKKFKGHAIFDQELEGAPNHVVMITGYGTYKGTEFYKIKNSWTSKWGDSGKAYVTIRQIREYTYTDGEVYCMGPIPPKRIMVFYTTKSTEVFAKDFCHESNKRFAISWSENLRQSKVIFIPNDLEDYANSVEEFKAKFVKESSALFLMDYEKRSEKEIEKDGIYLASFYELLNEDNRRKWLKGLKYAVFGFGLHQIAEVTDRRLPMLGAKRLLKMLRSEWKSDDEDKRQFGLWQNMIWKELEEVCKGGKGCTSRGGLDRRGRITRPLKNQKINWLYQNWWNIEAEFQWVKRQNLSYHLTKKQVQTLEPGGYLVDDVVNGYLQLLKEREFKYYKDELFGEGSTKFFFMPSDFMVQADNYLSHPYQKSSSALYKLFEEYSKQHNSPLLIESDYAFIPTCIENHWILFVWCISKKRILLFDPMSHDMEDKALREMYNRQYYIVEKLVPCMLNYLDASTYPAPKLRIVEIYKERPIQENINDSGVVVCKYVDAMCCSINLKMEKWSEEDVLTFRHRMAHELEKGQARHFSRLSVKRRSAAL